jgi:hypothetical protein
MSFIRKHSGDRERPIVCTYTCPEHGEFDAEVLRDENGEAPDAIECDRGTDATIMPGRSESGYVCRISLCGLSATWTPSPTVGCRVRRVEAVKGKWEKPERKTYLDTRELAEGMDPEEFDAKRKAVWEERRKEEVMQIKKGGGW